MASIRQPSFAAGEISPAMRGRTDVDKRAVALRRLRDFFVSRTGAAVSRSGTGWCESSKSNGVARLVPFIYSDGQTYVLEFGDLYVRFWSDGGLVTVGTPYEVVTPYAAADLSKLVWAQSGDIVTLTLAGYPPAELARLGHTSWTYTAIDFDRPAPTCAPTLRRISGDGAQPMDFPDSTHIAREWLWKVTELRRDDRGIVYESLPYLVQWMSQAYGLPWSALITYQAGTVVESGGVFYSSNAGGNVNNAVTDATKWTSGALISGHPVQLDSALGGLTAVVTEDRPVVVQIQSTYGLLATDPNFLEYRVYRGRGNLFGYVGSTINPTYTDTGDAPDYTIQPPAGRNPFKTYDSSGTLVRTDYPAAVAFFEGRRCFGGMTGKPGWIYLSATGDWANFDQHQLAIASDEVELEMASATREDVRFLVPASKLLAMTNASVWALDGPSGDSITAAGLNSGREQAPIGSAQVPPLKASSGDVLMVRAKAGGVTSLGFDLRSERFVPTDLSLLSEHFFKQLSIVDWTYAKDPWGLVWAARSDGALLCLAFLPEQGLAAWSLCTIAGGAVESVCAIPEGTEDAVYLLVRRTIGGATKRYVERFTSRVDLTDFAPYDASVRSGIVPRLLWRLDESSGTATAADSAGSYPLTTVVGTPAVVAGHSGNGRNFGGTSYLSGPSDAGTVDKIHAGNFTIRFWAKFSAFGDAYLGLAEPNGSSWLFSLRWDSVNSGVAFWFNGMSGNPGGLLGRIGNGSHPLLAGVWYHFTLTCTDLGGGSGKGLVYLNGSDTSPTGIAISGPVSCGLPSTALTTPTWFLGRGRNDAGAVANGNAAFDEVAFFDRVLTPTEIAADYAGAGPVGTLTGLDHLEGQSIYVLGDSGVEQGPFTVVGGSVTLTTSVLNAVAGLRFQPEMETLDLASSAAEIRTKPKLVTAVAFEAEVPVGKATAVSVGETLTRLSPARAGQVLDTDSETSEHLLANVPVSAKWGAGGRAALRVTGPQPVTVYGVTREVQAGGD